MSCQNIRLRKRFDRMNVQSPHYELQCRSSRCQKNWLEGLRPGQLCHFDSVQGDPAVTYLRGEGISDDAELFHPADNTTCSVKNSHSNSQNALQHAWKKREVKWYTMLRRSSSMYKRMTAGDGRWRYVACLGRPRGGGTDGVLRTGWGVRISKCGMWDRGQRLTARVWRTGHNLAFRCSFDVLKEGAAVL